MKNHKSLFSRFHIQHGISLNRLHKGEIALALPTHNQTAASLRTTLRVTNNAILGLHVLDDLGSKAANDEAWNLLLQLEEKAATIRSQLRRKSLRYNKLPT